VPERSPMVSVRVSASERSLLEVAAKQARTNLSDFVRRKALEAAEMDVLEQRTVVIPSRSWERFEDWVNAPARDVAALRKLADTTPVWQD